MVYIYVINLNKLKANSPLEELVYQCCTAKSLSKTFSKTFLEEMTYQAYLYIKLEFIYSILFNLDLSLGFKLSAQQRVNCKLVSTRLLVPSVTQLSYIEHLMLYMQQYTMVILIYVLCFFNTGYPID